MLVQESSGFCPVTGWPGSDVHPMTVVYCSPSQPVSSAVPKHPSSAVPRHPSSSVPCCSQLPWFCCFLLFSVTLVQQFPADPTRADPTVP